jgi:urease accessory protein
MTVMPLRQTLEPPAAQRAVGRLDLGFRAQGDATRIERFYQEGCLKARLPRPRDRDICEAVLMNISGGCAGGDTLTTAITLAAGAQVSAATQAAERVYRALREPAHVVTRITLGPRARLDYLPQETILFDGFGLRRSLEIELAADAAFLGVESFVFGRRAMGETVRSGSLRDRILLRREGKLLLADVTRLDGDIAARLARPAVAAGAGALATMIYAAPDAAALLPAVRAALAGPGAETAATALDGVIVARLLAPDAISLRSCVLAALRPLLDGRSMPLVWQV